MTALRTRLKNTLVPAGLIGLIVFRSFVLWFYWYFFFFYFWHAGRNPWIGSTLRDLLVILMFVYAHFSSYRFVQKVRDHWRAAAIARRISN